MPTKNVLEFNQILDLVGGRDDLAALVASKWTQWKSARTLWEQEKRELRNFVFATDTTKTSVSHLPWKNKTTLPKLTQIRDNLHANYMAALFPHQDWFDWIAGDSQSATKNKARVIKGYIKNKLVQSNFQKTISELVLDFIDYGNAFAEVIHVREYHTMEDGTVVPIYIGPKVQRISPFDIVFDITASNFKGAPKVTRSLLSLGQLKVMQKEQSDSDWIQSAFAKSLEMRKYYGGIETVDQGKADGFIIDGFSTPAMYFGSGLVEVLEFEGDIYDQTSGNLLENRRIIVIDRNFVALNEAYPSWLGQSNKEHVGWRIRPDNLMAMGPLDNLVGLQYRMDHLENLKADVFDQIAHPVVYQRGYVEDWEWGPGERIYGDTESSVDVLRPDSAALNADFQIQIIQNAMEEFAGAPKQAMGFRTPGEKTAFEVQTLENAAGRIFQNKIQYFESVFIEPLLNQMLEAGRRNLDVTDQIRVQDTDIGVVEFINITPEDITAKGKLVPMGARHFARNNQLVQNLVTFINSGAYQDPAIQVHISGRVLAQVIEELLGFTQFGLVKENVRVIEQQETQQLLGVAQEQTALSSMVSPQLAEFE